MKTYGRLSRIKLFDLDRHWSCLTQSKTLLKPNIFFKENDLKMKYKTI